MSDIKSFEDLKCWQKARVLRNDIKDVISTFPDYEKYELVSQMRRASRSVTHNIAEGYGRFHYQENIHFCRISRGSLNETLDHGIVALDEEYISEELLKELRNIHDKTLRILNGYIAYLKRSKFVDK